MISLCQILLSSNIILFLEPNSIRNLLFSIWLLCFVPSVSKAAVHTIQGLFPKILIVPGEDIWYSHLWKVYCKPFTLSSAFYLLHHHFLMRVFFFWFCFDLANREISSKWLKIYMDDLLSNSGGRAGAGVHSALFSYCVSAVENN